MNDLVYVFINVNEKEAQEDYEGGTHTFYEYDYHEFAEKQGVIDVQNIIDNPDLYLAYTPKREELTPLEKFAKIFVNEVELSAEQSLEIKELYPDFLSVVGKTVKKGFKFTWNGTLFETNKEMTIQSHYPPSTGTESLYHKVNEKNKGTIDDPIPWEINMILEENKYYIENNILYHCFRSSGIALSYKLSDLVGQFVNVAC